MDLTDLPIDLPYRERVAMTTSCRDCERVTKVPGAGERILRNGRSVQRMHCGVDVVYGGYHGEWMAEIIRRLRGHHEPQEELVFSDVMKRCRPNTTMLECGGFWSYYSLWFQNTLGTAENYVLEPDPVNIEVGKANFAINKRNATFVRGFIGSSYAVEQPFACESDSRIHNLTRWSVDEFLKRHRIDNLEILHADVQGAELDLLKGAEKSFNAGRIRFVFLSTHHHSISGDPLTHQRCLNYLKARDANILAEHTVYESFSGDGLIVAALTPLDAEMSPIPISHNRAQNCGYEQVEFELSEALAEVQRLSAERSECTTETVVKPRLFSRIKTRLNARRTQADRRECTTS